MNLIDFVVKEVLSEPIQNPYGWNVKCIVEDMSGVQEKEIFCQTSEEARDIKVGYIGQH